MGFSKSIFSISIINAIGVVVSVLNTVVVARLFGTTREIEVYFVTNVVIYIVMKLSQGGEMSEVLLPVYHRYKIKDNKRIAQHIVSAVLNWYIIFLVLLSIIIFLLSPWLMKIIAPGFSVADKILGTEMLRFIAPLFPVIFLIGQIQALLNAEKNFGKPEIVNVLSRIILICTIIIGSKYYGVWILIYSLWISSVSQFLILFWVYHRLGNRHYLILGVRDVSIFSIVSKVWTALPYVGATQLWSVVLNAGLSTLPQGTLAVFNYSRNLVTRIEGILLRPIAVVFFSYFSDELSKGNMKLKLLIHRALDNFQLFLFPIVVTACFASKPGLMFLWYGEKFSEDDVSLAALIFIVLIMMLFVTGLNIIARKIIMSQGYIKLTYGLLSLAQITTAIYAWYVIRIWGVNGALSAVIFNNVFSTILLFSIFIFYNKKYLFFYRILELAKWFAVIISAYFLLLSLNNNIELLVYFTNERFNYLFHAGLIFFLSIFITLGFAALFNVRIVRDAGCNIIDRWKSVLEGN